MSNVYMVEDGECMPDYIRAESMVEAISIWKDKLSDRYEPPMLEPVSIVKLKLVERDKNV